MANSFSPLISERVTLQPIREEDITHEFVQYLNDPEVVKYSNQRFKNHTLESSLQYMHSFSGTENLYLGIKNNKSQNLIGSITAYIEPNHGAADMGLMIGEPAIWGQGFGLEAWSSLMQYLFNTENIRKITGGTLSKNLGMIKIMEKSGMHHEATKYQQEILDHAPVDMLYFAKFSNA